ncbi:unnamed protein product [Acanthoscelides obtectus]|uniref:15-oxoprostaglandin 13-reductase n=1 Tax=Acanthoscelides obtectus TaxID=200917 RepID=A0A9P0KXG5_ACAOB|nr:unnamed protein product [Acanthoscelides obtectus]CAK1676134.1 Prostaglandin reductase 1 [Acanthoscelides obtectus]
MGFEKENERFAQERRYGVKIRNPTGIARGSIRASKNKNYPVGAYVHGYFGWRTYTIDDGCSRENPTYLLPTYLNAEFGEDDPDYTNANFNRIRASYGLGILGMPGIAAYFGMMEILHPQEDEVVVVSTAAGAVGSMATQIAKNILGCKVIAITGKNSKGDFLLDYYAIDDYINYTTHDVEAKLNILAPEGVDCYFDNAGGEISNAVIANMNNFGRIAQCGATSAYCGDRPAKISQWQIIQKQLTVEGFHCTRWHDRWFEAMDSMHRWWRGHTLMGAETSSKGFLNFREAFRYVFTNSSLGKVIISRK